MREKVIAICFLVFIFAISGQTIYNIIANEYMGSETVETIAQAEDDLVEGPTDQVLKEPLDVQASEDEASAKEESSGIIKDFSDKFTQNIATKEEFVEINTNASAVMSSKTYFESTQVLLGKDNWLFYKREDDGTSIPDYQGTGHYSEEKLREIADNLVKQRDVLAEQGVRFVVYIAPNKEVMYFEYMPDTIYRESTVTRVDELVKYLHANTDLEVVYPKNELMQAKTEQQLYFKYDTHWNAVGCFIGMQCLLRQLYNTYQESSEMTFVESPEDYLVQNDLAALAGVADTFREESTPLMVREDVLPEQVVEDKILFVGDSFGTTLTSMGTSYFPDGCNYMGVWTFDLSALEQYTPDIVVWECVERYTERMHFMDITG